MSVVLRQSTQIKVRVGPFVDAADGVTPETGVTLGAADQAEALKANGAATVDISGATWAAVTGADGWYDLTLTTSHTDTVGELLIVVQDSSVCLPVFQRFQVIEEALYDGIYAASAAVVPSNVTQISGAAVSTTTAQLGVNAVQISGLASAADDLEALTIGMVTGTSDSGTTTTMVDAARTESDNDYWKGSYILFTSGNVSGQCRLITAFDAATDAFTFAPATTQAISTQNYMIIPAAGANLLQWLGTSVTGDGDWSELQTDVDDILVDTSTTLQGELDGIQADTEDIQSRLPAALISGRIDATVGAMQANVMTAAAAAADLTTELQAGLATSAALATVDTVVDAIQAKTDNLPSDPADASVVAGLIAAVEAKVDTVDTVVDAVKAKTDSLTFTQANVVDAHIQYVAGEQVTGSGTEGDPWGPA